MLNVSFAEHCIECQYAECNENTKINNIYNKTGGMRH